MTCRRSPRTGRPGRPALRYESHARPARIGVCADLPRFRAVGGRARVAARARTAELQAKSPRSLKLTARPRTSASKAVSNWASSSASRVMASLIAAASVGNRAGSMLE